MNSDYLPAERMKLNFQEVLMVKLTWTTLIILILAMPTKIIRSSISPLLKHTAYLLSSAHTMMRKFTLDVKLEIKSQEGFPGNIQVYCIVIYNHAVRY